MDQQEPGLFTADDGMTYAQENPDRVRHQLEEEAAAVADIDMRSPEMEKPHEHQAHRTRALRDHITGSTEICACGAHRDVSLMRSSHWVGGNPPNNPWDRAHLEAVRRAVENTPPLLQMHPEAVQNINQALINDPPSGTEMRDQQNLASIYGLALGTSVRLLRYHEDEQVKKSR